LDLIHHQELDTLTLLDETATDLVQNVVHYVHEVIGIHLRFPLFILQEHIIDLCLFYISEKVGSSLCFFLFPITYCIFRILLEAQRAVIKSISFSATLDY